MEEKGDLSDSEHDMVVSASWAGLRISSAHREQSEKREKYPVTEITARYNCSEMQDSISEQQQKTVQSATPVS